MTQTPDDRTASDRYNDARKALMAYEDIKPKLTSPHRVDGEWLENHGVDMATDYKPRYVLEFAHEAADDGSLPNVFEPSNDTAALYYFDCMASEMESLRSVVDEGGHRARNRDNFVKMAVAHRVGVTRTWTPPSLSDGSRGQFRVSRKMKQRLLEHIAPGVMK